VFVSSVCVSVSNAQADEAAARAAAHDALVASLNAENSRLAVALESAERRATISMLSASSPPSESTSGSSASADSASASDGASGVTSDSASGSGGSDGRIGADESQRIREQLVASQNAIEEQAAALQTAEEKAARLAGYAGVGVCVCEWRWCMCAVLCVLCAECDDPDMADGDP
jgi:hypothetical protein